MKTLYLHIGTPKTGTSAIQHFLLKNRTVLEDHGYCFPELPRQYTYARNNRNGYFLTARTGYLKGLKQIEDLFALFDNIVLTEETLWRYLYVHPQVAADLSEHANLHGYRIQIIVYLRSQDDFIVSLWKEKVKHRKHALTLTLQERLSQVLEQEDFILQYASRLDDLAATFGPEHLTVRRYEKSQWKNGLIIDDFLSCIGLEHTPDFQDLVALKNPSLSENTVEIKRIINKETSLTEEENRYLYRFLRQISSDSSSSYPCSMLSKEESGAILDRFSDENARVAENYIRDGKPLFNDVRDDLPKWTPDNILLREDIIRFFSLAVIDLHRENEQLKNNLTNDHLLQMVDEQKAEIEALKKQLRELRKITKQNHLQFLSLKEKLKHPFHTLFHRLSNRKQRL